MSTSRLDEVKSELRGLADLETELESLKLKGGNIRPLDLQRAMGKLGFHPKRKKRRGELVMIGPFGVTIAPSSHPGAYGKGLGIKIVKVLLDVVFRKKEELEDEKGRIGKVTSKPFWNEYD